MSQQLRNQLWIVLAGLVIYFTNLGGAALWDMDEALYSQCSREMAARGDLVVPWFNGEMFPEKPPLMFWTMMCGEKLFGQNEFAVRFWSAIFAIFTALATYRIGRLLFREEVGFWAGLILCSTLVFTISARAATVDSALTLLITLAMLIVAHGIAKNKSNGNRAETEPQGWKTPPSLYLPDSWIAFVLLYAAIGLAVLAKGPVGAVMPLLTLWLFLLLAGRLGDDTQAKPKVTSGLLARATGLAVEVLRLFAPRNVFRAIWTMRPLMATLVITAIALPWYIMVGIRTDGRWLYEFMAKFNVGPAANAIQGHTGPFFYHFAIIFVGFFPWSLFLGPAVVEFVARMRKKDPWKAGYLLLTCWIATTVGLWTIVDMKLPHHILPAYPAIALITGFFIHDWVSAPARFSQWWLRNASITLVIVGLGIIVTVPIVSAFFIPGEWMLGLIGVILVCGGIVCLVQAERNPGPLVMTSFAITSVIFLTAIFGFAALRVDRHQNGPAIWAELRSARPGPHSMATFRFFRESFVCYGDRPIQRCHEKEKLMAFVQQTENPYILTNDEHEETIRQLFPNKFEVLIRQPRFLHQGEVIVFGLRQDDANPHVASKPHTKKVK